MDKYQGRLTVYFEDPFWVGVFERIENGKLSACKVTFGAEPKDYERQQYILQNGSFQIPLICKICHYFQCFRIMNSRTGQK